ncbi:unnamed protein product [Nippostrongylus brasiliensis]|uniref:RanBD1 domain-containing protein n=1 Tax=Nippostrongylus brasiliensis TaxID=27835 RepID=A0A0N4YV42_NIPBR|nr:unnamed protein product [Nippostrongylus brasiliensis]
MNTQVASTMVAHITKKTSPEPQKSPSGGFAFLVEDDVHEPTDLSAKTSAFAALSQKKRGGADEIENDLEQPKIAANDTSTNTTPPRHFTLRNVDERKINAQVAPSSRKGAVKLEIEAKKLVPLDVRLDESRRSRATSHGSNPIIASVSYSWGPSESSWKL